MSQDYISINIAEDETSWSDEATYKYRDEARDGHYLYAYAGSDDTNTLLSPALDYAENLPTKTNKWVQINPTNYFAMLDGKTKTQTARQDNITFSLSSEGYDSFCLLNLDATSVSVELIENGTSEVLYSKSFDLQDESVVIDAYTYDFAPFEFTPSVYIDDLPIYMDATLNVVINNAGSLAKCGRLLFGRSFYVGDTNFDGNLDLEFYQYDETDIFGNRTLVYYDSADVENYSVSIPTNKIPMVRRVSKKLAGKPVLFIADESPETLLENLLNFGFLEKFSVVISESDYSIVSISYKSIL